MRYHNNVWNGKDIFVFGSNLAGRHGAGAAKFARISAGAIYGNGVGLQGDSYAIPTKDTKIKTLTLNEIQEYVQQFIEFAQDNSHKTFYVTPIGTGLAGYSHDQIAPMFCGATDNVLLPPQWKEFLEELKK